MSPKGGKREGSGKPAYYGKAMKRINVMLDEETIAFYIEQGEGNLSEGIRKHWRSLTKRAADWRVRRGLKAKSRNPPTANANR